MASKKRRVIHVRILNPLDSGQKYTTMHRAVQMGMKGYGLLDPTAKTFKYSALMVNRREHSHREINIRLAEEHSVNQRGTIWWNGCHPHGIYPPFCNVQIPRPDSGGMSREHQKHRLAQRICGCTGS